ncbi:hydroxymethylglutaryl-CoA lyase [Pseudaminobacter sp. 19-2017]|uniref:Hydroxymethylglutaryl-CoA lyase n=1 Tax=Pseudaminobacter soli (ex Zhang et al. 2022) TaxID=2831468 RepID=A0A942EB15_9HYPH|nr:hydroxymethylglutaryl-CoA lyase [Pseudaminobacter soli]MBS3651777.1 hydroxymethylglutaryl-CoA lyase [Pseudaminobacter soli]
MTGVLDIYPAGRITLREVGLRDGLQLVKNFPSTQAKQEWIRCEYAAGMRHFEVGSFLPASRMPQFADVREMIETVEALPSAFSMALALNERGAADALATGVNEIVCVVSATEEHSQANARRTRAEAVDLVRTVARMRDGSGRRPLINAGIAMAFGCSIAGAVAPAQVIALAEQCLEAGADIVGIADTVGFAGPRQVGELAGAMTRLCDARPYIVHLHDTRGMGIANASTALDAGARVLDGSLGGLGGCPFAPGATGNVVMEDLVYLCETKGFRTGIDLDALTAVREIPAAEMPQEQLFGAVARAGPPRTIVWRS